MKHLIAVFIVICATAAFGQNAICQAKLKTMQAKIDALEQANSKLQSINSALIDDIAQTVSTDQQKIAVLEETNRSLSNGMQAMKSTAMLMPLYEPPIQPEPQQINVHVTQQPTPIAPSFPEPQVNFPVFCQSQTYGVTTYSNCF